MSVRVTFSSLYSDRIDGVSSVQLDGSTVAQVLEALTARFPALGPLVWSSASTLNPVTILFLNDEQLVEPVLQTSVRDGDEVTMVPAIEGGEEPCHGAEVPECRGALMRLALIRARHSPK